MKRIIIFLLLCVVGQAKAHMPVKEQPQEEIFETAWDVLNCLYDGGKIAYGYCTSNPAMVTEGAMDLALDGAAVFIPGAPAGSSKLARQAIKEGTKSGVKRSITRGTADRWIAHVLKRHGADRAVTEKGGKFFFSCHSEVNLFLMKAKERIAKGHAAVEFRVSDNALIYTVDMGEVIGTFTEKSKHKATQMIKMIIHPNHGGSMYPVKKFKKDNRI